MFYSKEKGLDKVIKAHGAAREDPLTYGVFSKCTVYFLPLQPYLQYIDDLFQAFIYSN